MRRGFKQLWIVVVPLGLVLGTALAWLACNGRWADAAPQPLPAALHLQPVTLAPADNAFYDGQGLRAPAGEFPNAWGQKVWRGEAPADAALAPVPSGDDWHCRMDCVTRWRAAAAALRVQMVEARVFGARCQALAARTAYQEPPVLRRPPAAGDAPGEAMPLPSFAPLTQCLRWQQVEAVLAPDTARAEAAWTRADALLRLAGGGAQTLIGHAVAWSWAERQQQLLAQWSAQQPPGYALPAAWLAPLPARLLQPQGWLVGEAHWQREMMAGLRIQGEQMFSMQPGPLLAWAGRHSLGYLPEATAQATAAHWLADLQRYGGLQGATLADAARRQPAPDNSWGRYLRWRNPVGHILVEVGRPSYAQYLFRQADVVLYQAALRAIQSLNGLTPGERAAAWARMPLDAGLRERITLEGDALLVRSWRGDIDQAHATPVRFPLRPV